MKIRYIGKKRLSLNENFTWYPKDEKELCEKDALYLLKDETYSLLFIEVLDEKVLTNKVTKKLKEK
jgi:hypothetical protein